MRSEYETIHSLMGRSFLPIRITVNRAPCWCSRALPPGHDAVETDAAVLPFGLTIIIISSSRPTVKYNLSFRLIRNACRAAVAFRSVGLSSQLSPSYIF